MNGLQYLSRTIRHPTRAGHFALLLFLVFLIGNCVLLEDARANAIYTYTGNKFNFNTKYSVRPDPISGRPDVFLEPGPFSRLSGTIQVDGHLLRNETHDYTSGGPSAGLLSYSFSDGFRTLTETNSFASIRLVANPNGAIQQWSVFVYVPGSPWGAELLSYTLDPLDLSKGLDESILGSLHPPANPTGVIPTAFGGVNDNPGFWGGTETKVPLSEEKKELYKSLAEAADVAGKIFGGQAFFVNALLGNKVDALLQVLSLILGTDAGAKAVGMYSDLSQKALSVASFLVACEAMALPADITPPTLLVAQVACGIGAASAALDSSRFLATAVAKDPPDPNFKQVFLPAIEVSPVPLTGTCSSLGLAAQTTPYALDQANDWLFALYVTLNRFQTAIAAGDSASSDLQFQAAVSYLDSFDDSAHTAAVNLKCFSQLLAAAGWGIQAPTTQMLSDALNLLSTTDISPLVDLLGTIGFTSMDIEKSLAELVAAPPVAPGDTVVNAMTGVAEKFEAFSVAEPNNLAIVALGMLSLLISRRKRFPT